MLFVDVEFQLWDFNFYSSTTVEYRTNDRKIKWVKPQIILYDRSLLMSIKLTRMCDTIHIMIRRASSVLCVHV